MALPKRKAIRLSEYDYNQNGTYYVTVCTQNRTCVLGEVVVGQGLCSCRLSSIGHIVQKEIDALLIRYPHISIPKYCIMPNHVHLLIHIHRQEQSPCPTENDLDSHRRGGVLLRPSVDSAPNHTLRQEQSPCPTVGDMICAFKSLSTKNVNQQNDTKGQKLWQARYYDHVIRCNEEYLNIWNYIDINPTMWNDDCYFIERMQPPTPAPTL